MADGERPSRPAAFVPLSTIKGQAPDPEQALETIRRIYFKTTRRTIAHDIEHAIDLLKTIPDEPRRDKAAVFMDGLAQMHRDWTRASTPQRVPGSAAARKPAAGKPGAPSPAKRR